MKILTYSLITSCILNITLFFVVNGQSITIFPYKQLESKTDCTEGLLANSDILIIQGEADFGESSSLTTYIIFQKYVKSVLSKLCLLDIKINQSENNCSFKNTERKNVYRFLISLKAVEELSEGKIIGSLTYPNSTELKHEISLPKIYKIDPTTVATVTINGEKANLGCNITVKDSVLKIEVSCQTFVKPCYLQLNFNDIEQLKQNENHLLFEKSFEKPTSVSVAVRSEVCSKDILENFFECRIRIEPDSSGNKFATVIDNASANLTGIIIGVILGVLLIAICVVCFILYKRGKLKCKCNNISQASAVSSENAGQPLLSRRETVQVQDTYQISIRNLETVQVTVEPLENVDTSDVSIQESVEPVENVDPSDITIQESVEPVENVDTSDIAIQESVEPVENVDTSDVTIQALVEPVEKVENSDDAVDGSTQSEISKNSHIMGAGEKEDSVEV